MRAITAIVVHDEEEPFTDLKRRLARLDIPSLQMRIFVETKYFLKRPHEPAPIFTAVTLPDGNWADVLEAAKNATPPCPVIVVSRFVDLNLYLEALQNEKGRSVRVYGDPFLPNVVSLSRRANPRLAARLQEILLRSPQASSRHICAPDEWQNPARAFLLYALAPF